MAEFTVPAERDGEFWLETLVDGYEQACATAGVACCRISEARAAYTAQPVGAPLSQVEVWGGRGNRMKLRARWELRAEGWHLVTP